MNRLVYFEARDCVGRGGERKRLGEKQDISIFRLDRTFMLPIHGIRLLKNCPELGPLLGYISNKMT